VRQQETSLKILMSNYLDFEEEDSLLQSMGRRVKVLINRTPKCHCELAGEGIEYSWGCAKNEYHRQPRQLKRRKEMFRDTVRKSIATDVLRRERIRLFSKRAREYMCAYLVLSQEASAKNDSNNPDSAVDSFAAIPVKIEELAKDFKTHQRALDFDKGFIKAIIVKTTADASSPSTDALMPPPISLMMVSADSLI
jgi:hypothetical protein